MGQLRTHDLRNLVNVDDVAGVSSDSVTPGASVSHAHDLKSFGVCISRRAGEEDEPTQCEVLWSILPTCVDIKTREINAKSRRLKAKWSPQVAEDFNALDGQVAEDLLYGRKTMAEVMQADSDIIDIMLTHRIEEPNVGDIEIKRRSRELLQRNTRDAIYDDDVYKQYDGARYRR